MLKTSVAALGFALFTASISACNHKPVDEPAGAPDHAGAPAQDARQRTEERAEDQAKHLFGVGQAVSPAGITVPNANVFIAVPDPVPPDYDGFQAVLVPNEGKPLQGEDAVRFVWNGGVRDPELLAQVAGLFLGRSRQILHESDRQHDYLRGHEQIKNPALSAARLEFFASRGSMAPAAYRMELDLTTFKVSERPANTP